jgi:hypothetical protein
LIQFQSTTTTTTVTTTVIEESNSGPQRKGFCVKTAVLVVSLHEPFKIPQKDRAILVEEFLAWSRRFGSLVMWTHLMFRPGYPEVGKDNKGMGDFVQRQWFQQQAPNQNMIDFLIAPGEQAA